jgi:amidohydrolase
MDALPLAEESGEEFASEFEGKSHGCGHDMHATSLIGTAILLNENREQLHGRVKLMWQPGEEIFEGMKAMIAAGIMENPAPDAALDLHVDASSPVGVLNYSKGPFTTSADNYLIKIKGSGCHGSMPENSIDPLNVAIQIYNAIASMRFREIKGSEFLAMSICSISSGNSFNIIPDSVEMRGTMRTYNPAIRDYVVERIEKITKEVASLYRAEGSLEIASSAPTSTARASVCCLFPGMRIIIPLRSVAAGICREFTSTPWRTTTPIPIRLSHTAVFRVIRSCF